jgi:hypothetical protein
VHGDRSVLEKVNQFDVTRPSYKEAAIIIVKKMELNANDVLVGDMIKKTSINQ